MSMYIQSQPDAAIMRTRIVPLAILIAACALVWIFTQNFRWVSAIVYIYCMLWVWRLGKHTVTAYVIRPDGLRVQRQWPYRQVHIPLACIKQIRRGNLFSTDLAAHASGGPNAFLTSIRRYKVIQLIEPHTLDEADPNSRNCLYWLPTGNGYRAVPPPKSDIRVRTFANNEANTVLLEGPVNYVISPERPDAFVSELSRLLPDIPVTRSPAKMRRKARCQR